MPVTVIVGGQYGSEGKGKICAHLAVADDADFVVRCGGPNSGHTVDLAGTVFELKQVPAGFVNPRTRLLLAAGALVRPALFLREVQECGLSPERVGIDLNAGIIEDVDEAAEKAGALRDRLGSTTVGMGSAVSRRVMRRDDFRTARDVPELQPYLTSVQSELLRGLRHQARILVEGTQGYGLSLYHTEMWPFCTSRETTAHSFLAEVGLGVRDFAVVMAIRTFPIRVGGNSGPMTSEISWSEVQRRSGYPHEVSEYTTTTKRLRRVAEFDWELVDRAVAANNPTGIALHGVDYLSYDNKGASSSAELTKDVRDFIDAIWTRWHVPVEFIGTGPKVGELIDARRHRVTGVRRLALA